MSCTIKKWTKKQRKYRTKFFRQPKKCTIQFNN